MNKSRHLYHGVCCFAIPRSISRIRSATKNPIANFGTERTSSMLTETAGKLVEAFAAHGPVLIDGDKIGGAGVKFKEAKPK